MAIRHIYGPQAGTLAGVAGAIGTGRGQQDAAKQQAELDRMTLGALLQDRSQQADFNFRAAGMYQNAGLQNAQMQNELQRQQIGLNMGAQQQAWNAGLQAWNQQANLAADAWQNQQQLAQREQLIQQEMQQKQFEYDLRNSSAAKAQYADLTSQEQALRRALDEKFITEQQYGEMRQSLAQKLAGFDPQAFPRDSQWEKGQGIGEAWYEDDFLADGTPFKARKSRNSKGEIVDDSELDRKYAYEFKLAQIKGESQTPNAAKPGISPGDYGKLVKQVGEMLTVPEQRDENGKITVKGYRPKMDEIFEALGPFIKDWQYRFDPSTPGPPGQELGPGTSAPWQGGYLNTGGGQSRAPGQPVNPQGMQFGGQGPQQHGVASVIAIRKAVRNPEEYVQYIFETNQVESARVDLRMRYPGGPSQIRQYGDPFDTHLMDALFLQKARATR